MSMMENHCSLFLKMAIKSCKIFTELQRARRMWRVSSSLLAVKGGNSCTLQSSAINSQTHFCLPAADDCSHSPQLSTHVYNYPATTGTGAFLKIRARRRSESTASLKVIRQIYFCCLRHHGTDDELLCWFKTSNNNLCLISPHFLSPASCVPLSPAIALSRPPSLPLQLQRAGFYFYFF